jgi:hypothetical protein
MPSEEVPAAMDAFEQLTRDMRCFAIEVKRLGYSMPAGYENQFLAPSQFGHTPGLLAQSPGPLIGM